MTWWLIAVSFLAGILTILAPCVLPLLPVIIGVSAKTDKHHSNHRPLWIIGSFGVSVVVFSLLINWLSKQFGIYQESIVYVSGVILVIFGLLLLFPWLWTWVMEKTWFEKKTWSLVSKTKKGVWGDVFIWVVLGPLLQSCSPTYGILIATILPGSFLRGVVNIVAYVFGLMLVLLVIVYGGRTVMKKLKWAVDPTGYFKRFVAIVIIILWVMTMTRTDKLVSFWLLEHGFLIDASKIEFSALSGVDLEAFE